MWQKAIVKMVKDERNKPMIGKEVWVEGPPSDDENGRFVGYGFSHKDPTVRLPSFHGGIIDYKTNIVQDGAPLQTRSTRLGLAPHMLELLPEFRELPPFIYFSEWSRLNA